MWSRVSYRLWQLGQMMVARPLSVTCQQDIATILSPPEQALFYQFSPSDQNHSYRVMQLVRTRRDDNRALLAAALLHDIGKTRVRLHWWDRVFIVVGMVMGKRVYTQWGQGQPSGWRKGIVVRINHPTWGADMAEAIGSEALTVTLVRRHQDMLPADAAATLENELLRLLQWADDQN